MNTAESPQEDESEGGELLDTFEDGRWARFFPRPGFERYEYARNLDIRNVTPPRGGLTKGTVALE